MEISKLHLFEGDILGEEAHDQVLGYRRRRDVVIRSGSGSGSEDRAHVWPNRTVYYKFSISLCELLDFKYLYKFTHLAR